MALIQLSSGRTINMDIFEYLTCQDSEIQDAIAHEEGWAINNPFTESCLRDLSGEEVDDYEDNSLFDIEDLHEMLSSDSFGEA